MKQFSSYYANGYLDQSQYREYHGPKKGLAKSLYDQGWNAALRVKREKGIWR